MYNGINFKNFNVFLKFYTLVVDKLYLMPKIGGYSTLQNLINVVFFLRKI